LGVDTIYRLSPEWPDGFPPDWQVAKFFDDRKDAWIEQRTVGQLLAWARKGSWAHMIGLHGRPGVDWFTHQLEFKYFPPGTTKNDEFQMHWVRWEGLVFSVISIPHKVIRFAERTAQASDLVMRNAHPTVIGPNGPKEFPLKGQRVYNLEYPQGSRWQKLANEHPGVAEQLENRMIFESREQWLGRHKNN